MIFLKILKNTTQIKKVKRLIAIKSLDPSNKLKQIEGTFPQNLMNDLVRAKSKGTVELQDIIKKDDLNYTSKRGKTYSFSKYLLPIVFLRHIHEGNLPIEGVDSKQSSFLMN